MEEDWLGNPSRITLFGLPFSLTPSLPLSLSLPNSSHSMALLGDVLEIRDTKE
jgi:hypothetical protein